MWFLVGMMLGAIIGVFTVALAVAASRGNQFSDETRFPDYEEHA